MEMRYAKREDLKWLKEIWKLSFGDEDRFIEQYFKSRDWINETMVLLQDDRIVSMQTLIPVDLMDEHGGRSRASMLFAVATHPDFQKKGFADQLIEFSNRTLLLEGTSATVLVPATEALFRFYEKRSYHSGFFIREVTLNHVDLKNMSGQDATPCQVTTVESKEYNILRRKLLSGRPYLDYRDEEISFQKKLAQMFGADLFTLEIGGIEGCAYAERISQEQVIVKELLIPDPQLIAAMRQISELLPAEQYIVRTPADCGEILGGTVRPFGMIRVNGAENLSANEVGLKSYLGIAYD